MSCTLWQKESQYFAWSWASCADLPVGTWLAVPLCCWDWSATHPPTRPVSWPQLQWSLTGGTWQRGHLCARGCIPVCCLCVPLPRLSVSDCCRSSSSSWALVATVESTSLFSSCPQSRCCYWNKGRKKKHKQNNNSPMLLFQLWIVQIRTNLFNESSLQPVAVQVRSAVDGSSKPQAAFTPLHRIYRAFLNLTWKMMFLITSLSWKKKVLRHVFGHDMQPNLLVNWLRPPKPGMGKQKLSYMLR